MIGKSPIQEQKNLFAPLLKEIINPAHKLVVLAKEIDWKKLEVGFAALYSHTGTPSKPVRLMCGLLLLKHINNLSDERVVEVWIQNPYFQYFCGASVFQWEQPCDPTDLVHFRKRIGKVGVEQLFGISVNLHCEQVKVASVNVDTTVQEKNITYPTDVKLRKKIIERCWQLSKKADIKLRQSYKRKVKSYLLQTRLANHPTRYKQGRKAERKLKTIAGRLIRDIARKSDGTYTKQLNFYQKVLNQKRNDKNKVYSLHEPEVACIAKGKKHKK